jgi:hypothetical protein
MKGYVAISHARRPRTDRLAWNGGSSLPKEFHLTEVVTFLKKSAQKKPREIAGSFF